MTEEILKQNTKHIPVCKSESGEKETKIREREKQKDI